MRPAAKRRRSGRRLFAYDRAIGVRFVAGADEAGRGCLAGPLVAAAVLFDLDRITPREVRTLGALNDSKQHTEAGREALYRRDLAAVGRILLRARVVARLQAAALPGQPSEPVDDRRRERQGDEDRL